MWFGQVWHGMMSDYLHLLQKWKVSDEDIQNIKQSTLKEMETIYEQAKLKDIYTYDKDNKFWFSEHFYRENIDEEFATGKLKILKYFDLFLKSNIHQDIAGYFVPENKVFVESKLPDFGQMQYTIEDIPELKWITLWAQPDLWIIVTSTSPNQKTKYIIYDRKTGRVPEKDNNEISAQLRVYAYKMLLKIWIDKFDSVEIFCYEVFIKDMTTFGGQVKRNDIYEIQQQIVLDVSYQKKFLQNQDPDKNIPLDTDCFPKTQHIAKCKSCRFRQVCQKLTDYEKQQPQSLF